MFEIFSLILLIVKNSYKSGLGLCVPVNSSVSITKLKGVPLLTALEYISNVLACVASVSVRFRSKEQGTRV